MLLTYRQRVAKATFGVVPAPAAYRAGATSLATREPSTVAQAATTPHPAPRLAPTLPLRLPS